MTPLIDIKEAARLLGVSAHTVRSFVSRGKIAHRRVGGSIRFTENDLAEFVEGAKVGVKAEPNRAGRIVTGEILPLAHYLANCPR